MPIPTDTLPYEDEAIAAAEQHDYDVAALSFHLARYQFGTLADTRIAESKRRIYRRAVSIAIELRAQPPIVTWCLIEYDNRACDLVTASDLLIIGERAS